MQVRVYESAISLISSADTRDAVVSMLSAKAYQAAIIRELLFAQRATATPYGTTSGSLTQSFADLTNKLAGTSVTGGIVDGNNQPTLVPTTGFGALKSDISETPLRVTAFVPSNPLLCRNASLLIGRGLSCV